MAKRKKKTEAEKEKGKVKKDPVKEADKSATSPEDERFDFGGMPNRDLKKSLGCG
jgi:hypothetical protein